MNLIETGHHEVNADCNPDLGAHCVLTGTVKGLDAEVLLDPLEKQLDLPAAFIDGRDCQRGQFEVVCQEDQPLPRFRINIANTPEFFRVVPFSFRGIQPNHLIASQAAGLVHRAGFEDVEAGVLFAADDEVGVGLFDSEKSLEIQVSTVKDVDASLFEINLVHEVHIMNRPVGNPHENRDRSGEIDLGVEFDCRLCTTEMCPRETSKDTNR